MRVTESTYFGNKSRQFKKKKKGLYQKTTLIRIIDSLFLRKHHMYGYINVSQ